jgi:hypothetical protein
VANQRAIVPHLQRKLSARSDRVKSVDLHPTEPWMMCSLYNGNVQIWNFETQNMVKSFEVADVPGMHITSHDMPAVRQGLVWGVSAACSTTRLRGYDIALFCSPVRQVCCAQELGDHGL